MTYRGCLIKPMIARRPLILATIGMASVLQDEEKTITYIPLSLIFRHSREVGKNIKQRINYVFNNGQKVEIAPRLAFTLVWIRQIKTLLNRYQNRVKSEITTEISTNSFFQQLFNSNSVSNKNNSFRQELNNKNYSFRQELNNRNRHVNHCYKPHTTMCSTNVARHNLTYFINHSDYIISRIKRLPGYSIYKHGVVIPHRFESQNFVTTIERIAKSNGMHRHINTQSGLQKNSQTSDKQIYKRKKIHSIDYLDSLINREKPPKRYQRNPNSLSNENLNHNRKNKSTVSADVVYRVDKPRPSTEKKSVPSDTRPPPTQAVQIDIDKITQNVINKIDKKIRIERERRGLL